MAGQGNRVRIARLIGLFASVSLAVAAGAGWWWYQRLTEARVLPHSSGTTAAQQGAGSASHSDPTAAPHPLDPVLERARAALAHHRAEHRSYTATMIKRERIQGKLAPENRMLLKLRYRPAPNAAPSEAPNADPTVQPPMGSSRWMDVYLRFFEPKSLAGREAIWRQGTNDDRLIVHEAGLLNLTSVNLAPTSGLAMMGNKYPITDIGIEKLLEKLIERGLKDRALGDCTVTVTRDVQCEGRVCDRIEILHPEPTMERDGQTIAFDFYRAVVDIDLEHEIPIHYAAYLWPSDGAAPPLDEEYTYKDLRLNAELSDADFDPNNADYDYP